MCGVEERKDSKEGVWKVNTVSDWINDLEYRDIHKFYFVWLL